MRLEPTSPAAFDSSQRASERASDGPRLDIPTPLTKGCDSWNLSAGSVTKMAAELDVPFKSKRYRVCEHPCAPLVGVRVAGSVSIPVPH